nr:major capsid protein [Rattus norvegicus microvirus]
MNNGTIKNFQGVPKSKIARTRFTPIGTVKTSFNAGKLVPIAVDEILPNTTYDLRLKAIVRGSTPFAPVMDNAFMDVYAFFVPNRLVWEHWEDFLAEAAPRAYEQAPQYSTPQITFSGTGPYSSFLQKSFWDYVGVGSASGATRLENMPALSALYPRGYALIWNEWFRDQNLEDPAHVYVDDTDRAYPFLKSDPIVVAEFGRALLPVSKFKDYFTSALPKPQKGLPVTIPFAQDAPVSGFITNNLAGVSAANSFIPLWYDDDFLQHSGTHLLGTRGGSVNGGQTVFGPSGASGSTAHLSLALSEATADLSQASAVTINALRLAFQTQRFQERLARSGSRYTELLRSMFGIYASDARLQRPEYLGGRRFPITQHQVAQTTENDVSQSIGLGDTGAFVFAADVTDTLVKRSFSEHGMVFYLACVRTSQTYSQGVAPKFTRRNRFDYYFPAFAHIGEQPIYQQEIYAGVGPAENKIVFGYKEPWVEYKYRENVVTADMRPQAEKSLAVWNYANDFKFAPTLTPNFTHETTANIDRTLQVQSSEVDQFFADFCFDFKALDLPMPPFNEPGLIDHN